VIEMARDERAGERLEDGMADVRAALRELSAEARDAAARLASAVELERRMEEAPFAVLGVAAAAGFVLGGGLWPVLRPFMKSALRTALSPGNLLAIGAAIGAMRAAGAGAQEPEPPLTSPATH
jgi:hypothetical protein